MTTKRPIMRGYTLVELIVSIAIFSIVMLVASAAFLSLIELDRRARATNDVVTNLSYVIDSMARSVRTGSQYRCGTGDCASTPRDTFSFTDADGRSVSYTKSGTAVTQCVNGTCMALTDPRVIVDVLAFYARGTQTLGQGDARQPTVTFIVQGYVRTGADAEPVEFAIESGATQRLIDL